MNRGVQKRFSRAASVYGLEKDGGDSETEVGVVCDVEKSGARINEAMRQ
jgi:hypothetical protein